MVGTCARCSKTKRYLVDNLLAKKSRGCLCANGQKYWDARAARLGRRYDAMVQRCRTDTHPRSKHYQGRGIRVLFSSREAFIVWALETYPESSFVGLEFDRIDNNGHYCPENLRLVPPEVNRANRSNTRRILYKGEQVLLMEWPSPYLPSWTRKLVAQGLSGEAIIREAKVAVSLRRKTWRQIQARLEKFGYTT